MAAPDVRTPRELIQLERLPEQYEGIAAGFRSAAQRLARASAASCLDALLATNLFLRTGSMETRLYISRQRNDLLFGFIKLGEEIVVLMDAAVTFSFTIVQRQAPPPALALRDIVYSAVVPSFFLAAPSAADAEAARAVLDADGDDVLFLQLDFGMLAAVRTNDFDRAAVAWLTPRDPSWDPAVQRTMQGKATWDVTPFLALARTIGLWAARGFESGLPIPVSLPDTLDFTSFKAPFYVLHQLCAAWIEASNRLRAPDVELPLEPDYDLTGYQGKVALRLDAHGQLAPKGQSDDLFQLLASVAIDEDANGVPRARVTIGPPDFLVAGPLYEAFLDTLIEDDAAVMLARELGLPGSAPPIQDYVSSSRGSLRDAALVFRVRHGKVDTNLITLHGTLNGLLQHVVLEGKFEVDAAANRVDLQAGSLRVLYTDRRVKDHPPLERGADLVRYFLQLLTNLRNWRNSLQ